MTTSHQSDIDSPQTKPLEVTLMSERSINRLHDDLGGKDKTADTRQADGQGFGTVKSVMGSEWSSAEADAFVERIMKEVISDEQFNQAVYAKPVWVAPIVLVKDRVHKAIILTRAAVLADVEKKVDSVIETFTWNLEHADGSQARHLFKCHNADLRKAFAFAYQKGLEANPNVVGVDVSKTFEEGYQKAFQDVERKIDAIIDDATRDNNLVRVTALKHRIKQSLQAQQEETTK